MSHHFVIMKCAIVSVEHPDLCIAVKDGCKDDCGKVKLQPFNGGENQQLILQGTQLQFAHSGKNLDIEGGEREGAKLIQYQQNGGDNQKWYWFNDGTIRSEHGFCLEVKKGKVKKGSKIIAAKANGSAAQKWRIVTRL